MHQFSPARRGFIRSSLHAAAFTVASRPLSALADIADAGALITRVIPASGERLPVIGLGTNAWGVESPEERAALRAVLEEMPRLGGTLVDTAQAYGLSEEVIGSLAAELGNRDALFIATKTPIRGEITDVQAALDTSFRALRTRKIDLMQVHNLHETRRQIPVFEAARDAGQLRYIGMSTSSDSQYPEFLQAMRSYRLDFIQVNYSIDDRSAADEILEVAREREMAVLVNVPFGGRRNAASTFARVANQPLPDWAADFDADSWAQVFLKYVVSHPAVTAAIPGTTNLRNLRDNQRAGRGRLPDAALRREIERYWDRLEG